MKLKVIGWTYNDDYRYPEKDASYAVCEAIMDAIREGGYLFSGQDHQNLQEATPVLNDGHMYSFSQRGWGGVMAEAHGETDPMDYAGYAFFVDEKERKMPPEEAYIGTVIRNAAREMLTPEAYDELFSGDYTIRYPQETLGPYDIYMLTPEEADEINLFPEVRQIPRAVLERIFPTELAETYMLDDEICNITESTITLPYRDELRYLDKGDTVVIGGTNYLVQKIEQYKDVSPEIQRAIMYTSTEGYAEALEIYRRAPYMIKIHI